MAPDTLQPELEPAAKERLFLSVLAGGHDRSARYRRLRDAAPVMRTRSGDLVLSLYSDCEAALRDRRLSVMQRAAPAEGFTARTGRSRFWSLDSDDPDVASWYAHNLLFKDPPDHTRLRGLLRVALTGRDWERLQPRVVAAADRCVADFAAAGGGDFVPDVAVRLPLIVLGDLLGVSEADRPHLSSLIVTLAGILRPHADQTTLEQAYRARRQLMAFFGELLVRKKEHPEDDLLSRLLRTEGSSDLTPEETMGIVVLMLAAGLDTTTCLLGNGLVALLEDPDQLDLLRADPELISNAVNEMMRFDPPTQLIRRAITTPVEYGGLSAAPGHFVILLLASANRDPTRYTEPDRFDVTRDEGGNIGFSSGVHRCFGAPLALMEAEAAFRALSRLNGIELAGDISYRVLDLKGPTSVPVRVE